MECASSGPGIYVVRDVLQKAFSVSSFSVRKTAFHVCFLELHCLDLNTGSLVASCVTLGTLLDLSVLCFLHLPTS